MRSGVSGVLQGLLGHFYVIEGNHTLSRHLMFLVALARDQDDVTRLGFVNGQLDRFAAVRLECVADASALQSRQGVVHDGDGIFTARIVAGKHDEIAAVARGFAHQGALGAVAVATATEYGDDATRTAALVQKIVRDCRQVTDGVVGVRIVDDHGKGLTEVEPLETTGDVRDLVGGF